MALLRVASPVISGRPHRLFRSFSQSHHVNRPQTYFNTLWTGQNREQNHHVRPGKVLRMLMFGKPGAGKGTLSARLVAKYDIKTISTGDLLRQHIVERTEIGRQAEEVMAHGGLVSDEVMLEVVATALSTMQSKHWILDGFPRTLRQGELLDRHLLQQGMPLSLVVNLDVPDRVILDRISDRWVHPPSGRVYNLSYNRPKHDGLDDVTGEPLSKRPDDNPEIFSRRLTKFYEATSPLLTYYTSCSNKSTHTPPHGHPHQHPHQLSFPIRPPRGLALETLSGRTSDEIWPKLESAVRSSFPGLKERQDVMEVGGDVPESRISQSLLSLRTL